MVALNVALVDKNLSPSRQSSDRNQTVRQRFVPSLGVSLSLTFFLSLHFTCIVRCNTIQLFRVNAVI
jgi:hypothetical protein